MAFAHVEKRTETSISLPAFICWLNCCSVQKREPQRTPSPIWILAYSYRIQNKFRGFSCENLQKSGSFRIRFLKKIKVAEVQFPDILEVDPGVRNIPYF